MAWFLYLETKEIPLLVQFFLVQNDLFQNPYFNDVSFALENLFFCTIQKWNEILTQKVC